MAFYFIIGVLGAVGIGVGVFGRRIDPRLADEGAPATARARATAVRYTAAAGLLLGFLAWGTAVSVAIFDLVGGSGPGLLVVTLGAGGLAVGLALWFSAEA